MDYCSSCRRHLNGALVCPGCGAYAPDIAPSAVAGPAMSAAPGAADTGTPAWEPTAEDTWYDGYFRDETAPSSAGTEEAPAEPSADLDGVPAVPEGRAARRRQRARWKKNQRRAVVATAVALVGGGLTVSAMNRGAVDKAQAATAPERPNVGLPQQESELTRPASTPPDTHKTSRTDTRTSQPSPTDAGRGESDTGRRESDTAPRTTRQFTRPDAAGTPLTTAATPPQAQTGTSASGGTSTGDSGGTSAGQQQTATPTPTPTDGSDSATSPSQTAPAPEETSPAQLCVLNVLCLG
ncbi:hypothetical protein ACIBU0_41240 [Streptomyces sp. NPDC049627]|uniref:SCO2400 family protein n=1 Tax=Streptomyces sp. NPDC049627 TaxID=3365595 RepID=UPI0037974CEF